MTSGLYNLRGVYSEFRFLWLFSISFTNYNLYQSPEFVGLKNYLKAFKDKDFIISVKNTLCYAGVTLVLQLSLGLFLAVLLYRKSRLIPIFRTAIYLPHVMSMVCVSMVWLWIYDANFGLFNALMKALGLPVQNGFLIPNWRCPALFLSVSGRDLDTVW